jgi:hypothetical protein
MRLAPLIAFLMMGFLLSGAIIEPVAAVTWTPVHTVTAYDGTPGSGVYTEVHKVTATTSVPKWVTVHSVSATASNSYTFTMFEGFEDGDYTHNPTWTTFSGNTRDPIVTSVQHHTGTYSLQSNATSGCSGIEHYFGYNLASDDFNPTPTVSVSFWFYVDAVGHSVPLFTYLNYTGAPQGPCLELDTTAGNYIKGYDGSSTYNVCTFTGGWQHIQILSYQTGKFDLWYNGVKQGANWTADDNTDCFGIGLCDQGITGNGEFWLYFDDISISGSISSTAPHFGTCHSVGATMDVPAPWSPSAGSSPIQWPDVGLVALFIVVGSAVAFVVWMRGH